MAAKSVSRLRFSGFMVQCPQPTPLQPPMAPSTYRVPINSPED